VYKTAEELRSELPSEHGFVSLSQGDVLDACPLVFWADHTREVAEGDKPQSIQARVMILTQACDLAYPREAETGRSRPGTNPERTQEMGLKWANLWVEMAENGVERGEKRGHFRRKPPPGAGFLGRITRSDRPAGPVHGLEWLSFERVGATRRVGLAPPASVPTVGRALPYQEPSRPSEKPIRRRNCVLAGLARG
jgi:hypothetical protein